MGRCRFQMFGLALLAIATSGSLSFAQDPDTAAAVAPAATRSAIGEAVAPFLLRLVALEDPASRKALAESAVRDWEGLEKSGTLSERMRLIAAIGALARRSSPVDSFREGYGSRSQAMLKRAVKEAPQDAWVRAMYGLWHLEAIRRGGGAASAILGASEREGLAALDAAFVAAPDDPALRFAAAVSLFALSPQMHASTALQHMDRAEVLLRDPAHAADAAILLPRIAELKSKFQAGNLAALKEFAVELM